MQLFYNLSDSVMEDELYEIESMRRFAGLTLANSISDETTFLNFRHFFGAAKPEQGVVQGSDQPTGALGPDAARRQYRGC